MSAADLFGPDWISLWVTGATLVALALWLFLLDVGNAPQRMFALLLGLRGLTFFLGPLIAESPDRWSLLWADLSGYATLALVPLSVAFLSLYPRRRGLGLVPGGLWLLLAATLAVEAWYAVDHDVHAKLASVAPSYPVRLGPLYMLTALRLPMFALAGFILAGDYRSDPKGSRGFSLFLMVVAFTLNGLYDGMLAANDLWLDLRDPTLDWLPWSWTRSLLPPLALPISIAACIRILPVLRQAQQDPELQEVKRFFAFGLPLALVTPFARLLPYSGADQLSTFILAIWRMAIPLLLSYALLRHQLFDIDLKLKDGVRRGIILGAFTVTFFLVSEAAESLVQGNHGPWFGVAGAGLLAMGSRPLQGFANRTADSLMPDTKPIAQQSYAERQRFYLDQFRLVSLDGKVSPKERRMLDRLRVTLALPHDAADRLEASGETPDPDAAGHDDVHEVEQAKDTKFELVLRGTIAASVLAFVFGMLSQGLETIIPVSNQVAGLIGAAVVALSLGPLEDLADRLTYRIDPSKATDAKDEEERRQAFRAALVTALEDGSLSERDLQYLTGLQKRLRIPWATRWRLERQVRRSLGP